MYADGLLERESIKECLLRDLIQSSITKLVCIKTGTCGANFCPIDISAAEQMKEILKSYNVWLLKLPLQHWSHVLHLGYNLL